MSETRGRCVNIVVFIVIYGFLCRVRNKIMYVLSWRTVSSLTRMLFLCLFPSLLRNSGNKHKNNPLVSAETVRHSSTYIILYVFRFHNDVKTWNIVRISDSLYLRRESIQTKGGHCGPVIFLCCWPEHKLLNKLSHSPWLKKPCSCDVIVILCVKLIGESPYSWPKTFIRGKRYHHSIYSC